MAYTLPPNTKAPILDQDGAPILEGTTSVSIAPAGIVSLLGVNGALYLGSITAGEADVTITPNGAASGVTHRVTVEGGPFDWTLGTPEPK